MEIKELTILVFDLHFLQLHNLLIIVDYYPRGVVLMHMLHLILEGATATSHQRYPWHALLGQGHAQGAAYIGCTREIVANVISSANVYQTTRHIEHSALAVARLLLRKLNFPDYILAVHIGPIEEGEVVEVHGEALLAYAGVRVRRIRRSKISLQVLVGNRHGRHQSGCRRGRGQVRLAPQQQQ